VTGTRYQLAIQLMQLLGDNVVVATTKLSAVRWKDWGSV